MNDETIDDGVRIPVRLCDPLRLCVIIFLSIRRFLPEGTTPCEN
jgi:hypothetical protein